MNPKILANTRAEAEMEGRPRHTKFWRRQEDLLAEAIGTALDDPEIQTCWNEIASELYAVLRSGEHSGTAPHVAQIETHAMFAPLISLLRERFPVIEYAWGSDLGPLIHSLTIKGLAPEIDVPIPEKMAHFIPDPDNPIKIEFDPSTGEAMFRGVKTATVRHFIQSQSYFESLAPPGEPGRPKGSPKPSKSGRRSISPEAALRAYDMDSRGAHWREIAKALWPPMTPADLRSEKTRLKVRYYIERGDRLARKKPVE